MSAVYRGRVRTGCLACRASKVKCDEQHPICKRCIRQHKQCVYTKKRKPSAVSSPGEHRNGLADSTFYVRPASGPSSPETLFSTDILLPTSISPSPQDSVLLQQQQGESPTNGSTPSTNHRSPSLISTLISQDIHICTTIDLLAAKEGRPSFSSFDQELESPFITPYDPVNWRSFKDRVLEIVEYSRPVAAATLAVQALFKARKNCLSHVKSRSSYVTASEIFDRVILEEDADEQFGLLLVAAFLLSLFEVLLPEETPPGPFSLSQGTFVQQLERWASPDNFQTPLSLRIASWLLISHAAARRSGNRGLLSPTVLDLLETAYYRRAPLPSIEATRSTPPGGSLLSTLTEPLFDFYVRLQVLSSHVADLSHYHRRRTTGADQEEVSILMSALKSRIEALWQSSPMLMRDPPYQLRAQFTSSAIAEPLILLATLCSLTYHTELVEMGRNLSAEQVPSAEARSHLSHMRNILSSSEWQSKTLSESCDPHPAFLRSLFLYAIESDSEADTCWAVSQMRQIKDPICYSELFANFAEGLSEMQRRKERRVTTKWWCLQAFGVDPPYL